jgi:GDP-D-mannose 3',5'-epimerase
VKTVVTGGTGFIGSHLVKKLVCDGREVTATSNSPPDEDDNLTDIEVQTKRCQVDLRNFNDTLEVIEGAESVFHLAAHVGSLSYLHGSQEAELSTLQSNLLIDTNVFRACLETGVRRIIYASSCAIYPMHKQLAADAVFTEGEVELTHSFSPHFNAVTINPDGGYGWSKFMGELQLNWMKDVDISVARLFNIYGENEHIGDKAHAIGDLTRRAIINPEGDFIVYGDGKQSRDFLYISDCVDALLMLEEKAGNPPLTVNIGSGKTVSIDALAQKIVEISGKKFNLVFDTSRPVGAVSRTADISMARSSIGWAPVINLEEGLKRTYAWAESKLVNESGWQRL